MLRFSVVRPVMLMSALLSTLSFAACNSGGESSRPSDAASNTPGAATNQSAGNAAAGSSNAAGNSTPAAGDTQAKAKLNLNTASSNDLLAGVPGLGNRMVHEFEEYRPYRSIQQFRREMGKYVGPEQIAGYEKHVYVPISVNEADAATLQQIPGLDATEAAALIAARPYASRDAFIAKLSGMIPAAELALARDYLSSE